MHKTNNNKGLLAILTLTTLLTACGGSGGGSSEDTDPKTIKLSDLQGLWKSSNGNNIVNQYDYIFIDVDADGDPLEIIYYVDKTDCYSSEFSGSIWQHSDTELVIDDALYTAELDGDNLTLTEPDQTIIYSRISSDLPHSEMCPININGVWNMTQEFLPELDCELSVTYMERTQTVGYTVETGAIVFTSFYDEQVFGSYDTDANEITWFDDASGRDESIVLNVNFNKDLVGYSESSSVTCDTKALITMECDGGPCTLN